MAPTKLLPVAKNKKSWDKVKKENQTASSLYLVLYQLTKPAYLSHCLFFFCCYSVFSSSGIFHPKQLVSFFGKVKRIVVIYDWGLELLHCWLDHSQCSSGLCWWIYCLHYICSGFNIHFFHLSFLAFKHVDQ